MRPDPHLITYHGAPRERGSGGDEAARPDAHRVRDVHEVVDLRVVTDARGEGEQAAVQGRVRLDLDPRTYLERFGVRYGDVLGGVIPVRARRSALVLGSVLAPGGVGCVYS